MKKFWHVSLGVMVLVGVLFMWIFVVGIKADREGSFYNTGQNAVWVSHEWAGEAKSDSEIADLVDKLVSHDIKTIFLHVGPLDEDGSIEPMVYAQAVNFVDKVERFAPEMKVLAWMGQVRSKLNLSDETVRHNILNMCLIFTEMIGMEGVHYDIEPVWDEDVDFILLLEETRELLGDNRMISVALAEFIPSSFVWWTAEVASFENYNTEVNYLNVAEYADQIVDMVYDTGIDREWLYRWFMREQVIWVSDLMGETEASGTEFLIGIPAYDEGEGFNPDVENVKNALLGVVSGLNDIRSSEENVTGVALYADWEMDYKEWLTYDFLWLGKE